MVRIDFTDADVKNKSGLNNLTDCAGKHAVKSCRIRNKIQFFTWTLGGDHLILRGWGWQRPGHIIYFQRELGRKIDFQEHQGQNIYFHPQQFFEKSKKKGGGGGRVGMLVKRGGRTGFSMFFFYFLQTTSNAHIYSVYVNGAAACLNVHLTINNMYTRYNSI